MGVGELCQTTLHKLHVPCCAAHSCLNFSTRLQCNLLESSRSGNKVRGRHQTFWMAQDESQLPELLHHSHCRVRNLCVQPVTKGSQGAMLCHRALCLFYAVRSRFQFYNFIFCQYPCQCHLPLRFFGKICKKGGYLYCA